MTRGVGITDGQARRGAATFELAPRPPYDFGVALTYLASSPSSVLEVVDRDAGRYQRAIRLAGQDVLLDVTSIGTVVAPRLRATVHGAAPTPAVIAAGQAQLHRALLLDADPAAFMAVATQDPVLGPLASQFPGLRPLLVAEPYEALLFAIIGQQVNVSFARKLKLVLVEHFGERLRAGAHDYPLFPRPERLAALDPAELTVRQFSRQKAGYVVGLSQAIAAGELNLDAVGALPPEEAIAELTRYRGVGRWTAEYVLMRGFGAPDSIPAADLGLRKIIGQAYGFGRNASEEEVRALAERWAGWRSWAAFVWWLALQTNALPPE